MRSTASNYIAACSVLKHDQLVSLTTKGTDLMKKSINIAITEIANGVIVHASTSPVGYHGEELTGTYFPSLEEAIAGLDQITVDAWAQVEANQRLYDREMRGMMTEKRAYADREGATYVRGGYGPGGGSSKIAKLPEERAVDASENIPVIDEDEAADVMVRDEPVMTTRAFDKGPPTSAI